MTNRQRILAVLKGQETDRIPFCPRMDLWHIANQARGTLPDHFEGMNTVDMAREIDVGCHAIDADYTLPRPQESHKIRVFGFENHPDYPYRVEIEDLPVEFDTKEESSVTRITTKAGQLTTRMRYTDEMACNGVSTPFIDSYPVRSVDDLEAVAQVFEHLKVVPTPDGYSSFQRRVGDQGIAVAKSLGHASPIHLMLHSLMPVDQFFYFYMDERKALYKLAERMEPVFDAILDAAAASSAEVVHWGSNFDEDLTYPPFFEQEILPWLKKACRRLHEAGKLVLCHLDGENNGLFPLYRRVDFDIGESICTNPMVKNSLKEIRQALGNEKTVYGGLPSISLLPNNMNEDAFHTFLNSVFNDLGSGVHLIFGISDNVPADADIRRFDHIKRRIEQFGPVDAAAV
jgi:uroporphyrinogen-III decarboxylase